MSRPPCSRALAAHVAGRPDHLVVARRRRATRALGFVLFLAVVRWHDPPPYPSIADAAWHGDVRRHARRTGRAGAGAHAPVAGTGVEALARWQHPEDGLGRRPPSWPRNGERRARAAADHHRADAGDPAGRRVARRGPGPDGRGEPVGHQPARRPVPRAGGRDARGRPAATGQPRPRARPRTSSWPTRCAPAWPWALCSRRGSPWWSTTTARGSPPWGTSATSATSGG
jgi:hypothetical protein